MTSESPRPKRRMKQPTKAALWRRVKQAEAAANEAIAIALKAEHRYWVEVGRAQRMSAARQHDHDIARRVPRWVRRIFRA